MGILVKMDSSELIRKKQESIASNMKTIDSYLTSKQSKQEPNPSTYYQVIENMQEIKHILETLVIDPDNPDQDIGKVIADILKRLDTIENDGAGSGANISITDIDINNPPSFYTSAITYEIKFASVVGLTESVGFDKNTSHAVIITYNNTKTLESVEGNTLKTFQIAFGNSLIQFYREKDPNTDTWTNWSNNKKQDIDPNRSVSWIMSDSMPEPGEQVENDYWIAPIDI